MTITITKQAAGTLIKRSGGAIFTARFVNKNGEVRDMNARLHVSKYVTGAGRSYNPADYGLIGVFDMQKDAHRMINLKTLLELKLGGLHYVIDQGE